MNIYLVRHADYKKDYGLLKGRLPVELSDKGVEQSMELRKFFKELNVEIIYSSAVKRCKQTAEIISDGNIEIEYDLRLLEALVPYQGYKEGSWASDAYAHQDELGGETVKDVSERITDFYESLITKNHENVVICSHGDPLYFLYVKLTGEKILDDYNELRRLCPDYQTKASIRLVEVVDGSVLNMNMLFEQEKLND